MFLAAVADKILVGRHPDRPGEARPDSSTSRSSRWSSTPAGTCSAFAQQASDIAAGNLRVRHDPHDGPESNDRGDVVLVDPGRCRTSSSSAIAEQEAAAQAAAGRRRGRRAPADRRDRRALRGATCATARSAVGLAAAVAEHVRDLGFVRGTVDNSAPVEESVVRYTGADGDAADAVAEQLGGIAVEQRRRDHPGHLMVLLGADFDPGPVPGLAEDRGRQAPPADPENITAAGVPCID